MVKLNDVFLDSFCDLFLTILPEGIEAKTFGCGTEARRAGSLFRLKHRNETRSVVVN